MPQKNNKTHAPSRKRYWWFAGIAAVAILVLCLCFAPAFRRMVATRQATHSVKTIAASLGSPLRRQTIDQGCQKEHDESLISTFDCSVVVRQIYSGSVSNVQTNPAPGKAYVALQQNVEQHGWQSVPSGLQLPRLPQEITVLGGTMYRKDYSWHGLELYVWYGIAREQVPADGAEARLPKGQVVYGVEVRQTYFTKRTAP